MHPSKSRYADADMMLGTHRYLGVSVGSEETWHSFPSLGICFDIGHAPLSSTHIEHVFITHGHEDHAGGLARHALRRDLWGLPPATYYVPEIDVPHIRAMLAGKFSLARTKLTANIVPVAADTEVVVGRDLVVRGFPAVHCIPCTGYTVWAKRKRLRAEFSGMPGPEIGRLRKTGQQVDEMFEVPEIAFAGDTAIDVLDNVPHLGDTRVLIQECTFLDDRVAPESARRHGHTHVEDFVTAAKAGKFRNEVVLLTHFSARHSAEEVRELLGKRLADLEVGPRVKILLPEVVADTGTV